MSRHPDDRLIVALDVADEGALSQLLLRRPRNNARTLARPDGGQRGESQGKKQEATVHDDSRLGPKKMPAPESYRSIVSCPTRHRVDSGHAFVGGGDLFQGLRRMLPRIRIQTDHLAARIALEDRQHHARADLHGFADEFFFTEPVRRCKIDIDVGAETPLVENRINLLSKLAGGLQRE